MDARWDKIAKLDLDAVREKFAFKKGWWWRLGHSALRTEKEYRQFLFLVVLSQGKTVVPWSRDVDDFWHEHILHTERYARDCAEILGSFIHHNPHLPEGSPAHSKALAETRQLYLGAFRERLRKSRGSSGGIGCGSDMPVAFSDSTSHHSHSFSSGHHGGGHGCGGHTGGGHGCGGHGCGGHGCGGSH